jgi:hypothetical protein
MRSSSRPGRLARARLGANVQRSMNAGFSTTHPPERANARPSASRAFPRACGSLWEGRNARCRPYRWRNMAMRRWYGKRIHLDVMTVRANRWSKASGSAEAARPLIFGGLQSGLELEALLCVAKCQGRSWPCYLVLATRCGAIPVLSEFVGDPPRDRPLGR